MKSRKRISRKLILTAGLLSVVLALYLHFGLLPGRARGYAIQKIEAFTGKRVLFSKSLYLPFEGLSFRDVKVLDQKGYLLFSAKKLALNARVLPFLTDKKIIVSNLHLDTPVYELHTEPLRASAPEPPVKTQISGQIDVPVVPNEDRVNLKTLEFRPDALLPENVYLEQIEILNGILKVRKNSASPVIEEINSIQIRMGFHKPPQLSFDGSVRLGHTPYAEISLKGLWDLRKAGYEFTLETKSKFIPSWLLDYQKSHFLVLKNGRVKFTSRLKSLSESLTLFHSKADLHDAEIAVGHTLYRGAMAVDAQGVFDFDERRFDRYKGTLELMDVDALHLTKAIDSLEKLNGLVRFQPDLLELDDIRGLYKNLPFQTDGALRSFSELNLEETIRVDSNIKNVLTLVSEDQKAFLEGFTIDGDCQALTTVRGSLRRPDLFKVEYRLRVENGSVHNPAKKISASNVSTDIFMDPSGVRLRNSRFSFGGKNYSLEAFIPKDRQAPGRLSLSTDEFRLSTGYVLGEDRLAIKNARLETRGLTADLEGSVIGFEDPFCDLGGPVEINLEKASEAFAKQAPFLKNLGFSGSLKGFVALKGPWNRPRDWELRLDGSSPWVFVGKKVKLLGAELRVRMKERLLRIPLLRARGYDGVVSGEATIKLSDADAYLDGKFYANDIDLKMLMRDLGDPKKEVEGKMIFHTSLSGALGSGKSLEGNGLINIRDGRFFKTDLFKSMGRLPFVKVEGLDWVEFTSLNGSFTLRDNRAWTRDLRLLSQTVDLWLEGSVGFDQSLDLRMDIRYSDDVMLGAHDSGGFVPFVVQQAENSLSRFRVSGTLKEPKYDKILI